LANKHLDDCLTTYIKFRCSSIKLTKHWYCEIYVRSLNSWKHLSIASEKLRDILSLILLLEKEGGEVHHGRIDLKKFLWKKAKRF
jgi:hypothetical protein